MIRFALKEDMAAIMRFIDENWKKGHILATNEEMFRYEFETKDGLNIAIALDDSGNIVGMEGFISYGHSNRDIMLVIWKVIKTDNPLLGFEIMQYIQKNADARVLASPGINRKTRGIYEYCGFITGKMTQWYRLNEIEKYDIAIIDNYDIPKVSSGKKLCKFESFSELSNLFDFEYYDMAKPNPYKEAWYIEKRYFNHPVYKYDVYGVCEEDNKCRTLLVFRKQQVGDSLAYRFVDLIGEFDNLYEVTAEIDRLVKEQNAEYADFYEIGMDEQKMLECGWLKVKGSGNVIPNYFAPFVQENIELLYCSSEEQIHLFKADGDQDRPN